MKNVKKSILGLAVMATVSVTGVYATMQPATKQPANVYTYYLEGNCDEPQYCSPDFQGPICSQEFEGITVYDEEGCVAGHEVINIIGKKPL